MSHNGLQIDLRYAQMPLGISMLKNIFLFHTEMETHDGCHIFA